MSDQLKPALSPEEWAAQELGKGIERHKIAALCLHGQPFGFTRKDVDEVRDAAMWFDPAAPAEWRMRVGPRNAAAVVSNLRSLAARIEALLPPAGGVTDEPQPPRIWWKGEAYTLEEYATMVGMIPLEDRRGAYRKLVALFRKKR